MMIIGVTGTFTDSATVSSGQSAAAAGQILSGYSAWVDGSEVKGSIATKTSSNMTVDGATVTAPAGYYASNSSKSVSELTLPTAVSASATAGYTSKATVSRSTSDQYINIGTGYNSAGGYYKISAVPNGSATTPATTITSVPSISVNSSGLITATNSKTQNVTPTVSAGYISSGTAGTITVSGSNTEQLTTQGTATYNTSSSNQTIASGTYLTGVQTIRGVTTDGITAGNIRYGATAKVGDSADDDRITSVEGTFTRSNTVSSGQTAASAAQLLSGYSAWVDGTEIQGSIVTKSAGDISVSGKTVTVAAGYYSAQQSKSVADGSGSTPATTITVQPSISVNSSGLITASNSKTQGVTPDVSEGYVTAGTEGNITVSGSNTQQLTTLGATTYTPSAADQTISSGVYLTGTQTISGDANLIADNIASGVSIFGVTGTHFGGYDVSDATASAADIRSGLTAYIASGKATGTYAPYLEFTNKTVAVEDWTSDATYAVYPLKATVACEGATADMFPYVEFSTQDAENGYLCPDAVSYNGGVYIYAVDYLAVTITKITFYKRS